ncbi:IclR family transcriptional regulator [Criibacterium bergeronii]|uniref:IclR family transcriptional regulator n=1 Tax=Criibacterium bergeronii TaxID=1871336 RepID=A0A552V3H7_9FIRM|nr:IclR family transcriptional regulator [Criibacterium bergeronii]TRW24997.1 IclR family transcriptional regulator [Criibacterium bergeronii]
MEKKNQSIERTFLILECFKNYKKGATLTDLSDATGLHKSTVFRFLNTLISLGYIRKSELKYHLTFKFYNIASSYLNEYNLIEISEPYLEKLSENLNEVVHLVVRDGNYCVYVNKIEDNNAITMGSKIGARIPLLLSSVGKAIISYQSDDEIKAVYEQSIINNLFDEDKLDLNDLMNDINETRQTGIGIDDEDNEPGIFCVGAAIKAVGGQIIGALSVTGPKTRMIEKVKSENIKQQVLETAKLISSKMGN